MEKKSIWIQYGFRANFESKHTIANLKRDRPYVDMLVSCFYVEVVLRDHPYK